MTTDSHTPGSQAEIEALIALADREYSAGLLAEATVTCQKILAIVPHHPEGHNLVADLLTGQGRLDEAVAHYEQALTYKPDYFEACDSLGTVLRRQGKLTQAGIRFQQAITLRPDLVSPVCSLGNVLAQLDRLTDAETVYRHALTVDPPHLESHFNLAAVLRRQGKLDQAIAQLELAIVERPTRPRRLTSWATCSISRGGQTRRWLASIRPWRCGPTMPKRISTAQDLQNVPARRSRSDGASSRWPLSPAASRRANRSTSTLRSGKALEDVGDYHRASSIGCEATALKRRKYRLRRNGPPAGVSGPAETFDEGLFQRLPRSAILRRCRSSSSACPARAARWSSRFWPATRSPCRRRTNESGRSHRSDSRRKRPGLRYPHWIRDAGGRRFSAAGEAYLASLPPLPAGKTRITDKALSNFFHVGLIRLILPNARIIHTLRDPVDTCVSCFSTRSRGASCSATSWPSWAAITAGTDDLMDHWRRCCRRARCSTSRTRMWSTIWRGKPGG